MTERFLDKVVLVTGGGSGIGRAAAVAFAAEGATVAVLGRSSGPLEETADLIRNAGGTASVVTADVSSETDVERAVSQVAEDHGRLDVAFNNAAVLTSGPVADIDYADWSATVAINLTGVWLSMKHEIKQMRTSGGGVIVNIASNLGAHLSRPGMGAYVATKAAVSALTRNTALEYIGEGIRINAVSPGPIETPMSLRPGETTDDRDARLRTAIPIGRVGTLDEITSAVLWLASSDSSFTVGHDLVVDGAASA